MSAVLNDGTPPMHTKKDFISDQMVRWCPGCGDYSILSQVQTVFGELPIPRESYAIVSGIGCSSRFPYYMETYGFHTIHGRAPAIATGLKVTRPDLTVWMVTGDGDCLSIGGNHFVHALRRNVDIKILMFNNRIYGLTKGQYSPTSEVGKKTKSTPMGSIDQPFQPLALALGAQGSFVARSVDRFPSHLRDTLHRAAAHKGTAFVEILQNCNIFNDGAFENLTERDVRDEAVLELHHGQPLVFGKDRSKGLVLDGLRLRVVTLGDEYTEADCVVHDETDLILAQQLARFDAPHFPVPVGVLYAVDRPTYDHEFQAQVATANEKLGTGDLHRLIGSGDTWEIGG